MLNAKTLAKGIFAGSLLLGLTACAPSAYNVKEPTPSGLRYQDTAAIPTSITQTDNRVGDEKVFSTGILPATLKVNNQPIDPMLFLASQVSAELASRGIPAKVTNSGTDIPHIALNSFRVQNHRVNAYTPFITMTFVSADIDTGAAKKRIGVFVKRGKVPVWSFDEVVEPTFNQPLSIAVKEYASKIANTLYNYHASDSDTDALIKKLSGSLDENSFLDVYALGFTNNPKAIDTLVRLVKSDNEYVRLAAISSLGNVGATSKLDLLKSIYNDNNYIWSDRAMALKAIGDLGTPESKTFLTAEMKRWEATKSNKEAQWNTQIIGLYL